MIESWAAARAPAAITMDGVKPNKRIGDAERDAAVASLQQHHAAGRLSLDEFDERMTAALSAKTGSDLAVLFKDLPGGTPGDARMPAVYQARPVEKAHTSHVVDGIRAAVWPVAILAGIFTGIHLWSAILFALIVTVALDAYKKGSAGR